MNTFVVDVHANFTKCLELIKSIRQKGNDLGDFLLETVNDLYNRALDGDQKAQTAIPVFEESLSMVLYRISRNVENARDRGGYATIIEAFDARQHQGVSPF